MQLVFFHLRLVLHACVQTFDVMGGGKNFWELNQALITPCVGGVFIGREVSGQEQWRDPSRGGIGELICRGKRGSFPEPIQTFPNSFSSMDSHDEFLQRSVVSFFLKKKCS
jgi:hypothetical protein